MDKEGLTATRGTSARYNKTIIETARNQIEGAIKYGKKNSKHKNG